ncbi:hypothetical protein D3D02_17250 [Halobellus sp. Atlit-38R]|nr:hypothetical protein D3D02_17250 [Halobellus sp. Atlit-38R]
MVMFNDFLIIHFPQREFKTFWKRTPTDNTVKMKVQNVVFLYKSLEFERMSRSTNHSLDDRWTITNFKPIIILIFILVFGYDKYVTFMT